MVTTLRITGLHCASCKALIEDVATDIPGVTSAVVDSEKMTATIEHEDSILPETLRQEIENLGEYKASII